METQVGIYLRLSRDDDREGESMSIENQRLILKNYVAEQSWELVDTYTDDGYTGTNFERPDFQRMIEDVKSKRINTVIVKDLSRFARNSTRSGEYTDYLFPAVGCRFIAVNDGVDTIREENDIMPFKNLFNEFYSRDISKKVRTAKKIRAKEGICVGSFSPYGYQKSDTVRKNYNIDPESSEVVKRIFEMRCRGMGYRRIAVALNEESICSPRSYFYKVNKTEKYKHDSSWSDTTVKNILNNEAYIGNLVQFKTGHISYKFQKQVAKPEEDWVRTRNAHPPIVSRQTWELVQKLNKNVTVYRSDSKGNISLFSGLLKCSDCGSSMKLLKNHYTKKDGTKTNRDRYVCGKFARSGSKACDSHGIREIHLTQIIMADIKKHAQDIRIDEDKVIEKIWQKKNALENTEHKAISSSLTITKNRLEELEMLTTHLYEEMVRGEIPRETLIELLGKYQEERKQKELALVELQDKLSVSDQVTEDIKKWVSLIKQCINLEQLDRELLMQLIDHITIGKKEIIDGRKIQRVNITYNFAGTVD